MQYGIVGLNPVEMVWQVVSDRRLHTVKEVASNNAPPKWEVASVFDFLEKVWLRAIG